MNKLKEQLNYFVYDSNVDYFDLTRADAKAILEELNKSYYENFLKGETENVVENLINDNYMEQEHKEDFEKVQNLTQEDIKNIVEILLSDNGLAQYIEELDSEFIEDTIFHYIHKEEVK